MTSTVEVEQRAARALRRRAAHLARIDSAPGGSRRRQALILSWLQSELANGGSLDDLIRFVDSMNAKAPR
ncbi:hypothetical protein ACFFX1_55145 [Dactylosporangium sucinum]|uniref:Uncharacterized protein n=1 Tax=Dactylosporangium sucinum TaxID=1424081 RepID=A0A917U3L7_9ACTN|nr:hypothetical protein [Dactylosporangium sucinum]GGM53006.1 hypothetical protein GCM10007977_063310 [Dactylosporangium sucinum]